MNNRTNHFGGMISWGKSTSAKGYLAKNAQDHSYKILDIKIVSKLQIPILQQFLENILQNEILKLLKAIILINRDCDHTFSEEEYKKNIH